MAPLIGITGEQKSASKLTDALDVIKTLDIDVFYGDYARAVLLAGGLPVWIPGRHAPVGLLDRLDGLLLSGGDDIDPAAYGQDPHPALGSSRANSPRRPGTGMLSRCRARAHDLPVLGVCRGRAAA